jgi:hypothetical protein
MSNTRGKEIHAVTIGDYFKYKGTVEFMETLARANAGGPQSMPGGSRILLYWSTELPRASRC